MTWTRNTDVHIQAAPMCTKARVSTIAIINLTVVNTRSIDAWNVTKNLQKRTWTSTRNSIVISLRRCAKHAENDSGGGAA